MDAYRRTCADETDEGVSVVDVMVEIKGERCTEERVDEQEGRVGVARGGGLRVDIARWNSWVVLPRHFCARVPGV